MWRLMMVSKGWKTNGGNGIDAVNCVYTLQIPQEVSHKTMKCHLVQFPVAFALGRSLSENYAVTES